MFGLYSILEHRSSILLHLLSEINNLAILIRSDEQMRTPDESGRLSDSTLEAACLEASRGGGRQTAASESAALSGARRARSQSDELIAASGLLSRL